MRAARKHFHKMYAMGKFAEFSNSFGGLLNDNGTINMTTCGNLFRHFDTDSNGHIEKGCLRFKPPLSSQGRCSGREWEGAGISSVIGVGDLHLGTDKR